MSPLEHLFHYILARLNVAFARELMRERQLIDRLGLWSIRLSDWQEERLDRKWAEKRERETVT